MPDIAKLKPVIPRILLVVIVNVAVFVVFVPVRLQLPPLPYKAEVALFPPIISTTPVLLL